MRISDWSSDVCSSDLRTRELHDAIKRRCLYHWLDYPERERELSILRALVPEASQTLTDQISRFIEQLRLPDRPAGFQRAPGIAEAIEWARALEIGRAHV